MIQRIQSIYLLLAAVALIVFVLLGVPYPSMIDPYPWLAYAMLGLAGIGVLLSLGAVFAYKDRPRQQQIVGLGQWALLLLALVLAATFALVPTLRAAMPPASALVGYLMVLLAYVLLRLAYRAIGRDIALVRSMDRLR